MSDLYTPRTDNNPDQITMPRDGDAKPVASVRVALEGVADLAGYCRALLTGGVSGVANFSQLTVHGYLTVLGANPADTAWGIRGDTITLRIGRAGETAHFFGNALFDQAVEVTGFLYAKGSIQGDGTTLDISTPGETVHVLGATDFAAGQPIDVRGTARLAGAGHISRRKIVMGLNSDLLVGPEDADVVEVPAAQVPGYAIHLKDGGADPGEIRLYSNSGSDVAVTGTGGSFPTLSKTTSGAYQWMDLFWDSAAWSVTAFFRNP